MEIVVLLIVPPRHLVIILVRALDDFLPYLLILTSLVLVPWAVADHFKHYSDPVVLHSSASLQSVSRPCGPLRYIWLGWARPKFSTLIVASARISKAPSKKERHCGSHHSPGGKLP